MAPTTHVSDSIVIAATPEEIYFHLSDPTQMGRWSEENVGATVLGEQGRGAYVGMQFEGHNRWNRKLRGRFRVVPRWTTRCVVTAAEPGRQFTFRAWLPILGDRGDPRIALPLAVWDYHLESVAGGTKVTETWTCSLSDRALRLSRPLQPLMAGGNSAHEFQRRNIASTLARLKGDLESGTRLSADGR